MQATRRDVQKQKVYTADKSLAPFKSGEDLSTVDGIRRYLIQVCDRKRVQALVPLVPLKVLRDDLKKERVSIHHGGGTTIARGGSWGLNFPLWSRTDGIVLHEFAHLLHAREGWVQRHAKGLDETYWQVHGWRFVQILEGLVLHCLGREAQKAYRQACKDAKVRMRPKKRLSVKTLENLRERGRKLAAARQTGSLNLSTTC